MDPRLLPDVPAPPEIDPTLEIVELHWERIQVVVRARGGLAADGPGRLRLERLGSSGAPMPATRAWRDGADLLLRFNVMLGPGQDPLVAGRWRLALAPIGSRGHGRFVHVRLADPTIATGPGGTAVFDVSRPPASRGTYTVTPALDPDGSFGFDIAIDLIHSGPRGSSPARLRASGLRAIRALRRPMVGAFFRVARRLARRTGRRILFTSDSHAGLADNLKLVHDRMVERGLDHEYQLLTLFKPSGATRRSIAERVRMPWRIARADVIVLDDYQWVIHHIDADPDVRIIQLWHASGAFKTVGYSRIGREGGPGPWSIVHKNYTHAIVSSAHDIEFYAEAFGIPEARVIPTGIPRMDRFFDEARRESGRAAAVAAFPLSEGRFTILFAPTFRGLSARDGWYDPAWIDYDALHALALEKDALVIFKMHPFVRDPLQIPEVYRDRLVDGTITDVDVNDLLLAVDLLVTDYSSIVFEYSVLARPMLFYVPDLEDYIASRDVYVPFESFVPGRIVRTMADLVDAIRNDAYDVEKARSFAARHFAHLDGSSTDRVIDQLILSR